MQHPQDAELRGTLAERAVHVGGQDDDGQGRLLGAQRAALTVRKMQVMPTSERLEAIGPRGEACIIIRSGAVSSAAAPEGAESEVAATYRLATGERLKPTDSAQAFETLDGSRRFTLR